MDAGIAKYFYGKMQYDKGRIKENRSEKPAPVKPNKL